MNAAHVEILTKSLMPLPDKWHGLADIEKRYRQRCCCAPCCLKPTYPSNRLQDIKFCTHDDRGCDDVRETLIYCLSMVASTAACKLLSTVMSSIVEATRYLKGHGYCRYVDLIVNEEVRGTLKARARMMGALRRVLEERGFLEVRR